MAKTNGYVVLTHDLDFGDILAATKADGPSVILIRKQDIPTRDAAAEEFRQVLFRIRDSYQADLEAGAIISFDGIRPRVRILPIRRD